MSRWDSLKNGVQQETGAWARALTGACRGRTQSPASTAGCAGAPWPLTSPTAPPALDTQYGNLDCIQAIQESQVSPIKSSIGCRTRVPSAFARWQCRAMTACEVATTDKSLLTSFRAAAPICCRFSGCATRSRVSRTASSISPDGYSSPTAQGGTHCAKTIHERMLTATAAPQWHAAVRPQGLP